MQSINKTSISKVNLANETFFYKFGSFWGITMRHIDINENFKEGCNRAAKDIQNGF